MMITSLDIPHIVYFLRDTVYLLLWSILCNVFVRTVMFKGGCICYSTFSFIGSTL